MYQPILDLPKIQNTLDHILNETWSLGVTFKTIVIEDENKADEDKEKALLATASCTVDALGDEDILIKFCIFDDASFMMSFVMDKVELTSYVAMLIHDYNATSRWLKAYISQEGYLVVDYCIRYVTNQTLKENIPFLLQEFVDEKNIEKLKPLCNLTEKDEDINDEENL